jgi:hypothetical protein
MYNQSEREKLISEYRELLKKRREATTKEDKEYFSRLASQKHDEILICEFGGDKNIGRFRNV